MSDIIEQIYNGMLSRNHDYSLEDKDLLRRDAELWNLAAPVLGREMVDALQDSQSNIALQTNLNWFREGIRVGLSLVLEVL